GTRPGDGALDRVADQAVAGSDDEREHEHAEANARAAFPEQQRAGDEDDREKVTVAADKRHERVEERIAQRLVDKAEQPDVHGLQPMHGHSLAWSRQMKTELRKSCLTKE